MGTTTTAAYVDDDEVVIAHVGDSRAYLLRDGELVRLTKDHSLVGELVARGKLTEEQAEQHPQRSVITRALGPEANVQVDIDIFPAKPGDLFLLCSDGLTSMVHEPKLLPLFEEADSLEKLGKRLIDAANAAGGRDNITVILFRLEAVEPREGDARQRRPPTPGLEEDTSEYDTFEGEAVRPPRQGVTRADAETQVGDDALSSAEVGRRRRGRLPPQRHGRAVGDPARRRADARRPRSRRRRRSGWARWRAHRAAPLPFPATPARNLPASAAGASRSASSSSSPSWR